MSALISQPSEQNKYLPLLFSFKLPGSLKNNYKQLVVIKVLSVISGVSVANLCLSILDPRNRANATPRYRPTTVSLFAFHFIVVLPLILFFYTIIFLACFVALFYSIFLFIFSVPLGTLIKRSKLIENWFKLLFEGNQIKPKRVACGPGLQSNADCGRVELEPLRTGSK
jgi:hypothetical protein